VASNEVRAAAHTRARRNQGVVAHETDEAVSKEDEVSLAGRLVPDDGVHAPHLKRRLYQMQIGVLHQ
jgi:hypothetical protein